MNKAMANTYQQLIGLHRAEFARAASLQRSILVVQAVQASMAVLSVFISSAHISYGFALISFAAACVWIWLWLRFRESRSLAERVRRLTYVADGLGMGLSESELLQIKARFSVSDTEAEQLADPNYYSVVDGAGPARVAGMIEQSAFWSADLLLQSANRTLLRLGMTVGGIVILLFSIPLMDTDAALAGARIACAALILPLSTDFLGAFFAYRNAATDVEGVLTRIQSARAVGFPLPDVLTILGDYNSAVEGAPMFVRGVYEKRNELLNRRWDEYQATLRPQPR